MSKGSKQRPTDLQKYGDNYDAIFGKKENPYMERAKVLAERNAMPDVQVAANMHMIKIAKGLQAYPKPNRLVIDPEVFEQTKERK